MLFLILTCGMFESISITFAAHLNYNDNLHVTLMKNSILTYTQRKSIYNNKNENKNPKK